jgi:chromosome segregation protein
VGCSPEALADATLPEGVAPTAARALAEELEERIARLGPVNPLAAIELAGLEAELGRMREASRDVRAARSTAERLRTELEEAIATRTIEIVGAVSEAFDGLMGRLFRGARGRVVLEDPSAPFSSPVALEIAIPARKVHRVGLLSGGERSLVSLAFLFAVLSARPVPFVVLDEVEAALDDKNLALFADLLVEMGATTQVIVVTHQRRTMEVASTLIGVSMSPKGSSRVVRHVLGDVLEA